MARRKFSVGDEVRANEKAPGDYEDRKGVVRECVPESQYGVAFAPMEGNASFGYLYSWLLDLVARAA
jgi:hypothetical protein